MSLSETLVKLLEGTKEPIHLSTLKAQLRRSTGHSYSGARVYAALQELVADGRAEQQNTFYFHAPPANLLLLSPPPSDPVLHSETYTLIHREFCVMLQEAHKDFEDEPCLRNLLRIVKIERYALCVGRAMESFKHSDADAAGKAAMARVQAAFSSVSKPEGSPEEQMDQAIACLEARHRQQLQTLTTEHQHQLSKLQMQIEALSQEREV